MFKRGGFSLIELLIALVIIAASWQMFISFKVTGQTAEREAEKLKMLLETTMAKAERSHKDFSLFFKKDENKKIFIRDSSIDSDDEFITASQGCSFERKVNNTIKYNYEKKLPYSSEYGTMTPGITVKIYGANNTIHYLIISGQGRVRTSETSPKKWEE